MCSPTLAISAASNGLKFFQAQRENRNARNQARIQNERAKKDRILKETAENYKIRQSRKEAVSKTYAMAIKAKQAQARLLASAEGIGTGGVIGKLIADYQRQKGMFDNKVLNNLQSQAFQSMRAKEAYRLGQEYKSKEIPPVDFIPNFAASSFNYATDYYNWKAGEEEKARLKKQSDYYMSSNTYIP